jgi:hypothetical protein
MRSDKEILIEDWWDKLSDPQQTWLIDKFYPEDNINTLEKVVFAYKNLTKEDLLTLLNIE